MARRGTRRANGGPPAPPRAPCGAAEGRAATRHIINVKPSTPHSRFLFEGTAAFSAPCSRTQSNEPPQSPYNHSYPPAGTLRRMESRHIKTTRPTVLVGRTDSKKAFYFSDRRKKTSRHAGHAFIRRRGTARTIPRPSPPTRRSARAEPSRSRRSAQAQCARCRRAAHRRR